MSNLTPKQDAFCRKYIETGNASEAYRQSYDAGDMKPATINRNAKALLDNSKIAARLAELTANLQKKHEITVDRVLKEYGRLAFLDIRKAFDEIGNLKPITELDDETAAAVAGLEFEDVYDGTGRDRKKVGVLRKLKLSDKKGALDSLARHLGMFSSDSLNLNVRKPISEMTKEELDAAISEYEQSAGSVLPRPKG